MWNLFQNQEEIPLPEVSSHEDISMKLRSSVCNVIALKVITTIIDSLYIRFYNNYDKCVV